MFSKEIIIGITPINHLHFPYCISAPDLNVTATGHICLLAAGILPVASPRLHHCRKWTLFSRGAYIIVDYSFLFIASNFPCLKHLRKVIYERFSRGRRETTKMSLGSKKSFFTKFWSKEPLNNRHHNELNNMKWELHNSSICYLCCVRVSFTLLSVIREVVENEMKRAHSRLFVLDTFCWFCTLG